MRSWWCLKDVRSRFVFCCCWATCCCWWPPLDPIMLTQPLSIDDGDDEDVSSKPAPSTLMYESSSLSANRNKFHQSETEKKTETNSSPTYRSWCWSCPTCYLAAFWCGPVGSWAKQRARRTQEIRRVCRRFPWAQRCWPAGRVSVRNGGDDGRSGGDEDYRMDALDDESCKRRPAVAAAGTSDRKCYCWRWIPMLIGMILVDSVAGNRWERRPCQKWILWSSGSGRRDSWSIACETDVHGLASPTRPAAVSRNTWRTVCDRWTTCQVAHIYTLENRSNRCDCWTCRRGSVKVWWIGLEFCLLPVVVFAAVDARLTGETGQGRVERPSALVAPETLAVPGLVNGHQVVAIGDLEPAAGADGSRGGRCNRRWNGWSSASFARLLRRLRWTCCLLFCHRSAFVSGHVSTLFLNRMVVVVLIKRRIEHGVTDRVLLNHLAIRFVVVIVVVAGQVVAKSSSRRPNS